ncbi:MAG: hypothetical protein ACE5IY_12545 [bacterium]
MSAQTFNILFICSGNSCRSPMAEGLMKSKIPAELKDKVTVTSAGTLGIDGAPATRYAIEVAAELGADISEHRSQGMSEELARASDVIFALSVEHKDHLQKTYPEVSDNVFLLRAFRRAPEEKHPDSIDDPIGRSLAVYRECCYLINAELDRILPRLQPLIENKLTNPEY